MIAGWIMFSYWLKLKYIYSETTLQLNCYLVWRFLICPFTTFLVRGQSRSSMNHSLQTCLECSFLARRVWRYQSGKGEIRIRKSMKDRQHTGQKDKQRSTKHTHKTKDRVTRTTPKTGGELRYSGRISSSCSTSGTRRLNLVTDLVINHEWGKDREVFTTTGTYP